jgi:hypothetical protein
MDEVAPSSPIPTLQNVMETHSMKNVGANRTNEIIGIGT